MNRIFLVLALIANALIALTLALGWRIGDPRGLDPATADALALHFLVALGTCILVLLVHAVALTYFMGTGRWIEETCEAYSLGDEARRANIQLKFQAIPGMVVCFLLVLATGAFGASADPASTTSISRADLIHFTLAVTLLTTNAIVNWWQYRCIARNGQIVNEIVDEVRRIRREKGLDSPAAAAATS
ncbi:MAG: hypothetical protein ACK5Q5_23135 [Planctomycetaceae bacterium]